MANIGTINTLKITKSVDFGVYLDGDELGEILLPKRYLTNKQQVGDLMEVFVYRDSDDLLIATTETPYVCIEQCAYLKVLDVNRAGAFLDWGLSKDLLVPYSEQQSRLKPGQNVVAFVFLNPVDQRIIASTKLHHHLNEESYYFSKHEQVEILVCGESDIAYKAVINQTHLGLLYKSDCRNRLTIGYQGKAYIKNIRSDHKIDLTLDPPQHLSRDDLCEQILQHLRQHQGKSDITDKSSPEIIQQQFGVSKSSYKKALGKLYKQRRIIIDKTSIKLT